VGPGHPFPLFPALPSLGKRITLHRWPFVSDIAVFVLKRDVKLQPTNQPYIIKIGPPIFAELTVLPNPDNPILYNGFQSARCPQNFPFQWFPWTHLTEYPKL